MNVSAVIDAAGIPSGTNKLTQLMVIDGLTIVERVVVNLQSLGIKDIIMITGYRAEQVEKALRRFGIMFLRNASYESTDILDSMKLGLRYLKSQDGKVLFCPACVPFFLEETVEQLLSTPGSFVLPVCREQAGYPVCIDSTLIPAILGYQGQQGIDGALADAGVESVCVPVEDKGVLVSTDSPEGYRYLAELHDDRLMRPRVKVSLVNKKPFFETESVTLLKRIDSLGSVKEACEKIGISYSKGWKMLRLAEEELGYKIVGRHPGGKNGGAAFLTDKGKKLLQLFEEYEEQLEKAAYKIYNQIFLESELF